MIFVIFVIILCILITINEILFEYQYQEYKIIIDYCLIYGILIMSLWESLFTFYRFYTAFKTTQSLLVVTTQQIMNKFMVYALIFSILFVANIHWYYWLFPVMILLNCSFNLFCNWRFAACLLSKYQTFNEQEQNGLNDETHSTSAMIKRVYYMRRISFICYTLQSIYFISFMFTQNVNIIYYLPLLWSINCCVYSLNFVRNRHTLNDLFKKKQTNIIPSLSTNSVSTIIANNGKSKKIDGKTTSKAIEDTANISDCKENEPNIECTDTDNGDKDVMPSKIPSLLNRPKTMTDVLKHTQDKEIRLCKSLSQPILLSDLMVIEEDPDLHDFQTSELTQSLSPKTSKLSTILQSTSSSLNNLFGKKNDRTNNLKLSFIKN